jgi:hypothetical protein
VVADPAGATWAEIEIAFVFEIFPAVVTSTGEEFLGLLFIDFLHGYLPFPLSLQT